MKFSPTVAEMADISPMCSIMVARAIGAITRMAVMSNLQSWKGGSPTQAADATAGEIQDGAAVRIGHSEEMHHHDCHSIGDHNAHEDRNDLEHAFSPDVEDDDCAKSDQGNEPVGGRIGDC